MYSGISDETEERERARARRRQRERKGYSAAAEEQLSALECAHRMEALGVPIKEWPTDALEAMRAGARRSWPALETMSTDELKALARPDRVFCSS